MTPQTPDANSVDGQTAPSAWNARIVLILLTLIAMVQFFDRALMVVIMEPLKQEFSLTDAQLGFLSGFSYAAAFALAGIPFGWMADRGNRRNLLAALLAIWSALVAFAGSANSFMALVLTRVGIGAADAGGQPCSVSIISDLYPTQRRASAVAIFFVGVPLGMASGFIVGAIVAGQFGWRTAFYVAAAPGVLLTILLLLLVKEPKRGASDGLQESKDPAPPLSETIAFMRSQKVLGVFDGRIGFGHGIFFRHDVLDWFFAGQNSRPQSRKRGLAHRPLYGRLWCHWHHCVRLVGRSSGRQRHAQSASHDGHCGSCDCHQWHGSFITAYRAWRCSVLGLVCFNGGRLEWPHLCFDTKLGEGSDARHFHVNLGGLAQLNWCGCWASLGRHFE